MIIISMVPGEERTSIKSSWLKQGRALHGCVSLSHIKDVVTCSTQTHG